VVESLNKVINCAHNNGWWFNKFVDARWFDIAANFPAAPLIASAHYVYDILRDAHAPSDLVSQIERCEGVVKAKPQPQQYGGFTVVYTADLDQPWNSHKHNLAIHFNDGSKKTASSLKGIARAYLRKMGESDTDKKRVREVYKELVAVVGTPDKYLGGTSQTWLIPDLSKHDLWRTIVNAQGIFRGSTFHLQVSVKGEEKYQTIDKPLGLIEAKSLALWWPTAAKAISRAGGDKEYALLDVRSDGIYAGALRIVALKNFQEVL
jgi:hypothetical protein